MELTEQDITSVSLHLPPVRIVVSVLACERRHVAGTRHSKPDVNRSDIEPVPRKRASYPTHSRPKAHPDGIAPLMEHVAAIHNDRSHDCQRQLPPDPEFSTDRTPGPLSINEQLGCVVS
jgi:hypothetical protein